MKELTIESLIETIKEQRQATEIEREFMTVIARTAYYLGQQDAKKK